jgi:hypothetical protein
MSPRIGAASSVPSVGRALRRLRPCVGAVAVCLALGLGCSGAGEGSSTGTAGSHQGGSGGTTGAAGTSGAAGTTGASGTLGSAGTTGAGGAVSTGGTTGAAGATGAAGTTGAAGAGGPAGATGSAGVGQAGTTGSGGSSGGGGGRGGASAGRGGTTGAAGRGGSGTAGNGGGGSGTAGSSGGAGGGAGTMMSGGCGRTPTLKNSPSATTFTYNTITSGGTSRQYILRWPDNYDKNHPYRLIIGLHGATGSGKDVARTPAYFGLFDLSQGSTIFIAPDAVGGLWSAAPDTTFVSDILKAVEADLCIDLTRVELEGFSQGAAMSWTLACSLPGTFRAAVGHSGGGVANPTTCQPIAYMGSLGLQEGNGQNTQTDQFAKFNGCMITTLPRAPTGGHVCTDYMGCPAGKPVRWCSYDGGHTPSPTDAGKSASWMPSEVWPFLSQF